MTYNDVALNYAHINHEAGKSLKHREHETSSRASKDDLHANTLSEVLKIKFDYLVIH